MNWLMTPLVVLLGLLLLVGADQLLITDHIIASVQQAPGDAALPINMMVNAATGTPDSSDADFELATELHRSLRFEPAKLDFGSWSIGMARSHTVTLVNQNTNRSVYLSSVSGKTPAFYSSFFESKVVQPQGNTTFKVVFLPRANGAVATSLLIHTSFGQAKLLVRGVGRECPYRLKPIVGIKAPLNSTLTPEIVMYNPHGHPLQILEVYSSGGQFQLELPSGAQEGPKALWEIPPYATKPVIRIRFSGHQAGNHTAYIRIKIADHLNESESINRGNENVLVVPVEFEILPIQGLYAENPFVDFGRMTTHDKIRQLKIQLKNSLDRSRPEEVVDYVLRDLPGLSFNVKDVTISLDPQQFSENMLIEELLVLKAAAKRNVSQTHEFSLLIRAEVFKGSLAFDMNATVFVLKSNEYVPNVQRTLVVKNQFALPLVIYNASVEPDNDTAKVFHIQMNDAALENHLLLQPDDSVQLVNLRLLDESLNFKAILHIYTNVTTVSVPLIVCSGLLHVQTMDSSMKRFVLENYSTELDLGIIPFAEMSQDGFIVLQNNNPLSIKLQSWDFKTPQGVYFHTTFMGCLRAALLKALKENGTAPLESSKFKFCSHLGENDVAVYQVAIKSYTTEENMGSLKIWTAYELITATVKFKTWVGKLEVDQEQLYFKNCFPGKLCSSDLSIRSTFLKPMRINSINFTDIGLTFKDFDAEGSWIAPESTTKVGRIFFEPAKLCQNRCYIPQDEKSNLIAFPAPKETRGGQNNNLHFDETELRRRTELFRHLKWYFQTISFTLNSNEIPQFQLYLIIDIEWPKLVSGKQTLPTVEVGKQQRMQVIVTNPSNHPILIDYFFSDPKFSKDTQLSLPLEVVDICTNCYLTDKDVYSLPAGAPKKPLLIPAATSFPINIEFSANQPDTYSTLLHIRNNLTLYEAIWVTSKTVQSQFKFGNRKPGSSTPLLFEVNEKHLSACANTNRENTQVEQLAVITKRTFTARNTGEIPIWIESFLIGDQHCEGFGFKILDCSSFALRANASKKIEIAFSPDFTAARVSRPLTLLTNFSYDVNYVLLAIMPPVSLNQCSELLPRPQWEQRIKNVALVLLATTFVFVLIAAHIDYGNVLVNQSILYMSRDKGPVHPTFNLRNIAVKSQAPTVEPQQPQTQVMQQHRGSKTFITQQQQQKANGNGNNFSVKKRGIKKVNTNGNSTGRNLSLSDITWPLEFSILKSVAEKGAKTVQTFSERSFKLKLEADKRAQQSSCSNSSSSVSSSEGSAKSTPPKTTERRFAAVEVQSLDKDSGVTPLSGNKSNRKSLKKTRQTNQTLANDKNDRDSDLRAPTVTPKSNNKSLKQNCKSTSEELTPTGDGQKTVTESGKSNIDSGVLNLDNVSPGGVALNKQIGSNFSDTNSNVRKYGKTPGRERKKDVNTSVDGNNPVSTSSTSSSISSNSSKRAERKQRSKATNSLNFNSTPSPTDGFNSISTPWETGSQVSFSHVLQAQNLNSSAGATNECSGINGNLELKLPSKSNINLISVETLENELMLTNNDLNQKQQQQHPSFSSFNQLDNFVSAELGPIGSKKSPSSTPVWEPLNGPATSGANAPMVAKPTLSNNSSFFSNLLPSSYGYNDNQQYMGLPANLYELKKAQEELQRQWQTNEYLFNLRQQQIQAQQQLQAMEATNNWQIGHQTWSPMDYGQNATANNGTVPNTVNNSSGSISLGPWQRAHTMRPPPGLEQNFQNNLQQMTGTVQQQQQQQSQQQAIVNEQSGSTTAAAAATEIMTDVQSMQTFDPFSSLSSIWSENWNKNNRNDFN